MSKKRLAIIIFVGIVLVTAISFYVYKRTEGKTLSRDNIITVSVSPVTVKDVTIKTHVLGTVTPYSSVAIRSLVGGILLKVGFKEGEFVHKNQDLFFIDPEPYKIKLAHAQANLTRDLAQLKNARSKLTRNQELLKKGYISKQDLEQLQTDLKTLASTVKADQADVKNAEIELEYCTIQSPIDGRAGAILIYPGNVVTANSPNPLVIINQLIPIYIEFSIPERLLPKIRRQFAKSDVNVTAAMGERKKIILTGKLSFIDNTVDKDTGMIKLKATFPNDNKILWPGDFVKVDLPIKVIKNPLLIPTLAIQIGPHSHHYVFIINNDNTVNIRNIVIGPAVDNNTVIKKGLTTSDKVVVTGQLRLSDGVKVQIAGSAK
jgi:multidrug efflux system membrane fusion protein